MNIWLYQQFLLENWKPGTRILTIIQACKTCRNGWTSSKDSAHICSYYDHFNISIVWDSSNPPLHGFLLVSVCINLFRALNWWSIQLHRGNHYIDILETDCLLLVGMCLIWLVVHDHGGYLIAFMFITSILFYTPVKPVRPRVRVWLVFFLWSKSPQKQNWRSFLFYFYWDPS